MFTLPTTQYERIESTGRRTARELGESRAIALTSEAFADDDMALSLLAEARWESKVTQTCPHCGTIDQHYFLAQYRRWKCRATKCSKQFSVFSGTKFHNTKLSAQQVAMMLFVWQEGAEGMSSRELSALIGHSYQATHVQVMKMREALWQTQDGTQLGGMVEADAAFFNRHIRPPNLGTGVSHHQRKADAAAGEKVSEAPVEVEMVAAERKPKVTRLDKDARAKKYLQNPNMHALVAFVERLPDGGIGRVRTGVVKTENQTDIHALSQRYIHPSATVLTDESGAYSMMLATAAAHARVKHKTMFVDPEGTHTNHVECFFAEMRRSQAGRYHRFGLGYLQYYAAELGWRLEMRDKPNDIRLWDLARRVLCSGPSIQFADVWNKRPRAVTPRPKVPKPEKVGLTFPVSAGSLTAPPQYRRRKKNVRRDKPRAS